MKLDLKKSYDNIDLEYLRLTLLTIVFVLYLMEWIMSCVTSSSFVVLINGEATDYFKSGRGLRQGFPLSLYLFILIMEGLSLMFKKSISEGKILGIKVSKLIKIVHILFVDDVLIMSKENLSEWIAISNILQVFCLVSGMSTNNTKTIIHYWGLEEAELIPFKIDTPFSFVILNSGFKYLGYYLNPSASKIVDWYWLAEKLEKKIGLWCINWLSLGGRFILVKVVLESQSVFCMSMEHIPCKILSRICKLMFDCLWNGNNDKH